MDAAGVWQGGLIHLPNSFLQSTPVDTPEVYDGVESQPNRLILQCMLFCHSLLEPRPVENIWVRCMICWLARLASIWAEQLIADDGSCLQDFTKFLAMLLRFYQIQQEKTSPKFV